MRSRRAHAMWGLMYCFKGMCTEGSSEPLAAYVREQAGAKAGVSSEGVCLHSSQAARSHAPAALGSPSPAHRPYVISPQLRRRCALLTSAVTAASTLSFGSVPLTVYGSTRKRSQPSKGHLQCCLG